MDHFRKLSRKPGQKTDRWDIESHDGQRFYAQWRCYIAEPPKVGTKKQTELWRD